MTLTKGSTSKYLLILYCISVIYVVLSFLFENISYIDECVCILLFIYGIIIERIYRYKEFIFLSVTLLIYLIYSLAINLNVNQAVFRDFLQFLKPFTTFYVISRADFYISNRQKHILTNIAVILVIILTSISPFIDNIYPNTTTYYYACFTAAIMYFIFSKNIKKNKIFILMLLPGLLSYRAKYISEIAIFIYILFFFTKGKNKGNISFKTILLFIIIVAIAIILNKEKFSMYFINGLDEGMARTHLYAGSINILRDYFPIGSGLGTFGTDASGLYYSQLYYDYNLYNIFGCRPEDYGTGFSFFMDTFYPVVIAQFGLIGLILLGIFWIKRWNNSKAIDISHFKLFLILFGFEVIEGIAGTAFLSSITIPAMFCLGFSCNKRLSI